MEDFFKIDIPVFSPQYDENTRYGWSRYKDNLWELLSTTTGGYCMYCYDSICVNGHKRGEIEHGIEKINDEKSLSDCIYDRMFKFSNIKSIKTKAVNIKVLHIEKYIKIRYDNKQ